MKVQCKYLPLNVFFYCLFPYQQLAQNFHSEYLCGPEHRKVIFDSQSITINILMNKNMTEIPCNGLTIDEEWKITPNDFPLEVLLINVCTCTYLS